MSKSNVRKSSVPRPVVLHIAASLDGFIATMDDGLDWLPAPDETEDFGMNAFMATVDTVLMGRRTWDITREFEEQPFADMDLHVLSRSSHDAVQLVNDLKAMKGGTIWLIGGGLLNASLLSANLVDEVVVTTIPVMLERGIPLYGPLGTALAGPWAPVDTVHFDGGIVQTKWLKESAERGI